MKTPTFSLAALALVTVVSVVSGVTTAGCGGSTKVTIPDGGAQSDMPATALGCAGLSKCINNCGPSSSSTFSSCADACISSATPNAYNLLVTSVFYCPAEEFCRDAPDGGTAPCSADDVDPTKTASQTCKVCVADIPSNEIEDKCADAIHDCTSDLP